MKETYSSYRCTSQFSEPIFSDSDIRSLRHKNDTHDIVPTEPNISAAEWKPRFEPKVSANYIYEKKSNKRQPNIYKWLRDRISGIDYGVEIEEENGKHPIHLNKNYDVLKHFELWRQGEETWLKKISNQNFVDHHTNVRTFYFAGASEPKKSQTLVMIDIDCKKFGTPEGAMAFAEYLRDKYFPNMYIEVSTHGRGAHGFFVLEKCQTGSIFINDLLLDRLQPFLRAVLAEADFDVENVEIKGTLPVLFWGEKDREVTNYKSGTLAKLPRLGSPEKEEALRNTTVITVNDLMRLPIFEKPRGQRGNGVGSASGSISGKHISEEELGHLSGQYRAVAEALLGTHTLKTTGRTVVTVEDVAIFLMLLKFFTKNMNADGSLPTKRWMNLWSSLYGAGDVDRAFCPQRFKAMRDFVSSLGLLDWEDETYSIGILYNDGEYKKGQACKWRGSEQLMAMLEVEPEATLDKGEEGRAPFIRTDLLQVIQSLTQRPPEQTIRPVLVDSEATLRLNPDEIADYIKPFEAFTGLAA